MKKNELAAMFIRKAEQDLTVFEKWRKDPEIAQEILGFHAQQSAEKMLTAILSLNEIEFPLTHRLTDLIDLLKEHKIKFPEKFESLRYLTPFAVEYRYDLYDEDEETIDLRDFSFAKRSSNLDN